MNTNNGVKWRRLTAPSKVERINDYLFIDTYKRKSVAYTKIAKYWF